MLSIRLATLLLSAFLTWNPAAQAEVKSPVHFRNLQFALNLRGDSTVETVHKMYRIHSAELLEVQWAAGHPHWLQARNDLDLLQYLYSQAFGTMAPQPDLLDSKLEERLLRDEYANPENQLVPPYTINTGENPNPLIPVTCQGLLTGVTRH